MSDEADRFTREALARAMYIEHKRRVEPAWGHDEPPHIWDHQIAARPESRTTLDYWTSRADDLLAILAEDEGK